MTQITVTFAIPDRDFFFESPFSEDDGTFTTKQSLEYAFEDFEENHGLLPVSAEFEGETIDLAEVTG